MGELFGTDGIRGLAGQHPLDKETVCRLGEALVELGERRVLIGRDTRESGPWVEETLRRAIESRGGRVESAGVITTPGVAFLARGDEFDAGVMISASHNPYQYNGIKIFSRKGMKLSDSEEERIEALVSAGGKTSRASEAGGAHSQTERAKSFPAVRKHEELYKDFLASVPLNGGLKSVKVVLDCANGAAFSIAPDVFQSLGASVVTLSAQPDGRNINQDCGALHPERMARAVVEHQADFGVAFDGDADRAILADENGNIVDGDFVLYILGRHFKKHGLLRSDCVVSTVMANIGLEVALRRLGVKVLRTKVGDRYVLEEMIRGGHDLGGEQSGHTIILQKSAAGDGILSALQIVEALAAEGRTLGELRKGMEKYPQVLLNVTVNRKPDLPTLPKISELIDAAQAALGAAGRLVIRYSGTEPLARVMVEGVDDSVINAWARAIAEALQEELG